MAEVIDITVSTAEIELVGATVEIVEIVSVGQIGPPGPDGTPGDPGPAGTITAGTTTTLPAGSQATVVNVGTPQAAILNFGIPTGVDGATGAISGVFYFAQIVPNAQWVISHGLGFRPSVFTCDSAGDEIIGEIRHLSVNQLTIDYSAAISGTANLS